MADTDYTYGAWIPPRVLLIMSTDGQNMALDYSLGDTMKCEYCGRQASGNDMLESCRGCGAQQYEFDGV